MKPRQSRNEENIALISSLSDEKQEFFPSLYFK